jgi:protocatechuate 3,4-dioxygenase, alpha subunit
MTRLVPTAEMTLGPFFPREFAQGANDLSKGAAGEAIEITGRVAELDGRALDNVILEIWQADAAGRFDNPDFPGWGRAATDAQGEYLFRTVKPGACAGRAPHVNFLILYSGLMRQLQTVMFFDAADDPVLQAVEHARRDRLIAKRITATSWRFDIRLRGGEETPFFDD